MLSIEFHDSKDFLAESRRNNMATIVKNSIPERVLTLLQTLNAQQLVEVTHFMEFLRLSGNSRDRP